MATVITKTANPGDLDLAPIRKRVLDAVRVMFDRAVALNPDEPQISDNKEEFNKKGPLQDCEFGMILLLVHEWFKEDGLEGDFFAEVRREEFGRATVALVQRVVDRVLRRQQTDEGGEGNGLAFFSGEPYTEYKKDPKDRAYKYSANLDAAMITLAFLAPAVEQYNDELAGLGYNAQGLPLPDWVGNLRDAALFVILEGLRYALDCRVLHNGKFLGFTSDPRSRAARPEDGSIELDTDRLFFTWTACETINDMKDWRGSYLVRNKEALPPPAVSLAADLIGELDSALVQAAEWCEARFYSEFRQFQVPETESLVQKVTELGGRRLEDITQRVDQMEVAVQYVYHMSQYAAVRSLVPSLVSFEEVDVISDKLESLVSTSIVGSQLDASKNEELFRTLTRKYSLGTSTLGKAVYNDDAWYPLVVRSLSGLLARTLDDMGERFDETDVEKLISKFQRSLNGHYVNMVARRPEVTEEGDGQLWSFAKEQPYVLYATQRTIFALMTYKNFLVKVHDFQAQAPKPPTLDVEKAVAMFSRQFTDLFRPAITEVVLKIQAGGRGRARLDGEADGLPLPEEPWAAAVVRDWLKEFTKQFTKAQVAEDLSKRCKELVVIRKYAENYKPSAVLLDPKNDRKRRSAESQLEALRSEYQSIRDYDVGGQKPLDLPSWDAGQLAHVLFRYLFAEYLERPGRSFEDLLDKQSMPELWKLIKSAKGTQENISNLDPTADPTATV
ncbi:MAG: hypothetical protein M3444_02005 [Acidobacteriota bacterium]|nr:hypothetical protein [Acidobacteriota bacterium]MDQ5835246.1 hypothetical protein [Acidobacteriota bacterium]